MLLAVLILAAAIVLFNKYAVEAVAGSILHANGSTKNLQLKMLPHYIFSLLLTVLLTSGLYVVFGCKYE